MVQPFEDPKNGDQTMSLITIESKLSEGLEEALQSSLDLLGFQHLHAFSAL